jgi:hypothetical protein
MNTAFNCCFETSTKLVDSAGLLGFIVGGKKKSFGNCSPPSFTNAYWPNSRARVQGDKLPGH